MNSSRRSERSNTPAESFDSAGLNRRCFEVPRGRNGAARAIARLDPMNESTSVTDVRMLSAVYLFGSRAQEEVFGVSHVDVDVLPLASLYLALDVVTRELLCCFSPICESEYQLFVLRRPARVLRTRAATSTVRGHLTVTPVGINAAARALFHLNGANTGHHRGHQNKGGTGARASQTGQSVTLTARSD